MRIFYQKPHDGDDDGLEFLPFHQRGITCLLSLIGKEMRIILLTTLLFNFLIFLSVLPQIHVTPEWGFANEKCLSPLFPDPFCFHAF